MLVTLGMPAVVGVATVVGVIVLRLALGRWREPVFLAVTVAAQAALVALTAQVVSREAPDVERLDGVAALGSYPSAQHRRRDGAARRGHLARGLARRSPGRPGAAARRTRRSSRPGRVRRPLPRHAPPDRRAGRLPGRAGVGGGREQDRAQPPALGRPAGDRRSAAAGTAATHPAPP